MDRPIRIKSFIISYFLRKFQMKVTKKFEATFSKFQEKEQGSEICQDPNPVLWMKVKLSVFNINVATNVKKH